MKRRNGFTLIELLAVIVILAIIAVIAVPIVLNIIDESKDNATLRSAEMYLDAVELSMVQATLKNKNIQDGTYNILQSGNICLSYDSENRCNDELKVEVNGETPNSGTITIHNGKIEDISISLNDKTIVKNNKGELVYQEITDPVKLCTANTTKATALVFKGVVPDSAGQLIYDEEEFGLLASTDGAYTPGVAYTCNFIDDNEENNMTFFVLSSTENEVTLISGANLGSGVAWSSDDDNHKDESEDAQAVTAKAALASGISTWEKIKNMEDVTVKMPTAYQIAEAVGQTFSGSNISGLPTWLYSYTKTPVAFGYWTSTPDAEYFLTAWGVAFNGNVGTNRVDNDSFYGVRPVITISKSNI